MISTVSKGRQNTSNAPGGQTSCYATGSNLLKKKFTNLLCVYFHRQSERRYDPLFNRRWYSSLYPHYCIENAVHISCGIFYPHHFTECTSCKNLVKIGPVVSVENSLTNGKLAWVVRCYTFLLNCWDHLW